MISPTDNDALDPIVEDETGRISTYQGSGVLCAEATAMIDETRRLLAALDVPDSDRRAIARAEIHERLAELEHLIGILASRSPS